MRANAFVGTVAVAAALASVGCELVDSRVCTANIAPGIVVTIVDSMSGEPRAAVAMGEALAPGFADTLDPSGSQGGVLISRQGAYERVGIYEVVVRAPGYEEWRQTAVRVHSGECHVQTVQLQARLKEL